MRVPIIRIPFSEEDRRFIHEGIDEVLASGNLTLGRYTEQFEAEFARFVGVRHAVLCANGTAALELILRGLGVEARSVVVPTNTFLASAFAVMHAGNRVIFADSDPATFALDPDDVRRRLAPDTAAVMLVHIGGVISPAVDVLRELCAQRRIHLIEDCAHAHGSTIDGRQAGALGVAGAFSFFPTKVLTTGEGGMVTTDDEALARRVRMLRNHGKDPDLGGRMSEYGYNYRASEITAVLGLQQMRSAAAVIADRQRTASYYDAHLRDVPGITPLAVAPNVRSSYYKYIAHLDPAIDRGAVKAALRSDHGVALTGEVYADLCHTEPLWERVTYCGRHRNGPATPHAWAGCPCDEPAPGFPGAERLAPDHVCLPVYPGLTEEEAAHVVESLRTVLAGERQGVPA